jgi:hypothetical protein
MPTWHNRRGDKNSKHSHGQLRNESQFYATILKGTIHFKKEIKFKLSQNIKLAPIIFSCLTKDGTRV